MTKRPYVCGALGTPPADTLARLHAASPTGLHEITHTTNAHLWSTTPLDHWQTGDEKGHYWSPAATGTTPRSWRDAAEQRLAAGLTTTPETATLHTCSLGLQELYTRHIATTLYFATRIEALLDLDDTLLHTDENAWASIICLGYPLAAATPFTEIRRMTPATAWQTTGHTLHRQSFEPHYLNDRPHHTITTTDLAALLTDKLPHPPRLGAVNSTLSGGWDSRLLAGLLTRAGHRTRAWTTSPDDGRDHDLQLAAPVARALRMKHRTVIPPDEAWLHDVTEVNQRAQHQVAMHTWLMPLARRLHHTRGPLVDGLAGDVLLKSLFVTDETVDAPTPAARRAHLWQALSRGRVSLPGMFTPHTATHLEQLSRAAFDNATEPLDGHPAAATLAVLLNRTMRGVAVSPMLLFGPECDVHLPFVHPHVLEAALSLPVRDKIGGAYYRELLDTAVGPTIGQLPSTNDPRPKTPFGYRRQTSARAVNWMATTINNDETARQMTGPRMRTILDTAGGHERLRSQSGVLAMLQAVTMYATWHATYASRLASTTPILVAAR